MVQFAKMLALESNFVCIRHGGTVDNGNGDFPESAIESPCFGLPCTGNAGTTCHLTFDSLIITSNSYVMPVGDFLLAEDQTCTI
jgi:hypothetical protein